MGSDELLGQLVTIRGSRLWWKIIRFRLRKLDRAKCQGWGPVGLNKKEISGTSDHVYTNNLKQVFTHS